MRFDSVLSTYSRSLPAIGVHDGGPSVTISSDGTVVVMIRGVAPLSGCTVVSGGTRARTSAGGRSSGRHGPMGSGARNQPRPLESQASPPGAWTMSAGAFTTRW